MFPKSQLLITLSLITICYFFYLAMLVVTESEGKVAQSCLTLCNPMDCSLPGFSVHGILQARILEWVTISFYRGSSQPKDQTEVSWIARRHFNLWATREAHESIYKCLIYWYWIINIVELTLYHAKKANEIEWQPTFF